MVDTVISVADTHTQEYLRTIQHTMGRVSEINALTWDDVNLAEGYLVLYTRKKAGGHRTPRKVPLTACLEDILSRKYHRRTNSHPWVFWHRYWSRKQKAWVEGPFNDRKRLMGRLCRKAGLPVTFGFHALRHSGASLLEKSGVPISSIQRILGHENRKTTEIYLHSLGDAEREAMAVFERVARKSNTQIDTPYIN